MSVLHPAPSGIVTLLTDFGVVDPYVGVMKGAMLQRAASVRLVDLCHDVAPQDIDEAAFWLSQSYRWFPAGTVHLVVVDPGVGTTRQALAACAEDHYFVAPDNGVLGGVLSGSTEVRRLDASLLGDVPMSRTFHGRDLFGPMAAMLASAQLGFDGVGPTTDPFTKARLERAHFQGETLVARVVSVDRFGNLITDAERSQLGSQPLRAELAGRSLPLVGTYAELEPGECGALIGSFDTLEIACRNGSAARTLGVARGAEVRLEPLTSPS